MQIELLQLTIEPHLLQRSRTRLVVTINASVVNLQCPHYSSDGLVYLAIEATAF